MTIINHESSAVHTYINILQALINRMASNSAAAKTWCITLVSAIMVFASDNSLSDAVWIALIPVLLFLFLDAYYLGLERGFRLVYNEFIKKLHDGSAKSSDLYLFNLSPQSANIWLSTSKAILSTSVWPFYFFLILMLAIFKSWIY